MLSTVRMRTSAIAMFALPALGCWAADEQWHALSAAETPKVVESLQSHFDQFRSVGMQLEWLDGERKADGSEFAHEAGQYVLVADAHRQYFRYSRHTASKPADGFSFDALKADDLTIIDERLWNESLERSLGNHARINTIDVATFALMGRSVDGRSWAERYKACAEDGWKFTFATSADVNIVHVEEAPEHPSALYWRQAFDFDRSKQWAVVRNCCETVDQEKSKVVLLSDVRFSDFREVKGFFVPFHIAREADAPDMRFHGVQRGLVREATVNDASHGKILTDFHVSKGPATRSALNPTGLSLPLP
jgi:hypothetical protein